MSKLQTTVTVSEDHPFFAGRRGSIVGFSRLKTAQTAAVIRDEENPNLFFLLRSDDFVDYRQMEKLEIVDAALEEISR